MPKPTDIPPCPGAPSLRSSPRVSRDYDISLVTPLFGGGVEAGKPDALMPIRCTSIRGHLQFWWRATRGSSFRTREELFARHAKIWGNTEQASPVVIELKNVLPSPTRPCARYDWNPKARQGEGGWKLVWETPLSPSLHYVLFPFQGKQPRTPHALPEQAPGEFIETASFILRLRYPETLEDEVSTAVWAWVNFGGLGARTRRGCGALFCKELAPRRTDDLQRWFGARAPEGNRSPREWPTVPSNMLVGEGSQTPLQAWTEVIKLLQEFRQGAGLARNTGQSARRPGRSRYPEPETIRRVTAKRSQKHERLPDIPNDAFPRAEFGLPIVFQFQGQGEPPTTVLYPSNALSGEPRERMASPLLLKPLVLTDGKAMPMIMRILTPPLAAVDLREEDESLRLPSTTVIRGARLSNYKGSPLIDAPSGSAIDAFLLLARKRNFREIT